MSADYAVYRVYDDKGECIYVGASINPFARAKQHAAGARWWRAAARIELDWFASVEEAAREEERLIHEARPRFNRAGVTARFQPYSPGPGKRPEAPPAEHVSIGVAASLLNISASTLRRWEREGRIYAYRTLGGQRRYRRDHIDRLRTAA